ncbi:MAG: LL-diaminopimelate aminotransferase [Oscillospiraceae bacterium]|nr:LL-diaminopimelate aminotransferase [Oscillospiraceae bacterium]
MNINKNYQNLKEGYLFQTISEKVKKHSKENPDLKIIRLGIGDVTRPLAPPVIDAMHKAVAEMGMAESFRGYGDYEGYSFLRAAVCGYYAKKGVALREDEVFVSDGAKSDLANILDIFSSGNTVVIPDPVYPVYVDTNIMAGRKIIYMDGNADNAFLPMPKSGVKADIIYLCSPNNPTGAVYGKKQLERWVSYALENDAVILFDGAYEIFVQDRDLPTSIYQISGADRCAIEFCSLSKTAGFTGTRCGYTVVPQALMRDGESLNKLWLRRQATKFNGVSYVVQRGAEAVFTKNGMERIKGDISYYLENARIITDALTELGIWFTGGKNAPYIWLKCPGRMSSWEFFDVLLCKAGVVATPGAGFGANGEGFLRLTAFGDRENLIEAMGRIKAVCG